MTGGGRAHLIAVAQKLVTRVCLACSAAAAPRGTY